MEVSELWGWYDTISQGCDDLSNRKVKRGINDHIIKDEVQSPTSKVLLIQEVFLKLIQILTMIVDKGECRRLHLGKMNQALQVAAMPHSGATLSPMGIDSRLREDTLYVLYFGGGPRLNGGGWNIAFHLSKW